VGFQAQASPLCCEETCWSWTETTSLTTKTTCSLWRTTQLISKCLVALFDSLWLSRVAKLKLSVLRVPDLCFVVYDFCDDSTLRKLSMTCKL